MICLTVFKRTTPVDFSEPASLGSVSAKTTLQLIYSGQAAVIIKLSILSVKDNTEAVRTTYSLSGTGEANHLTTSP